ncbi:S1 RNA-binding domain-containing protein [Candidatus Pacearchaeota archaeon]|nr:S1 RNA-binding domain-containing protein [Candidatus Pacearchaeota archaeon]
MTKEKNNREIVIPGEVIAKGEEYLPGEGTEKIGNEIIAIKYGLAEEFNRLIRIIPLSGVYQPRNGNVIIGEVENITFYGWVVGLDAPEDAFLPLQEVPKYVSKDGLSDVFDIGDMLVAKIVGITNRGIDLTVKGRGLGKVEGGIIIKINPSKVPRIIGKEGSMINIIKQESNCDITVGQNGLIWIKGDEIENELLVKKAINFIAEKSFASGLTDEIKDWFEKEKNEGKRSKK